MRLSHLCAMRCGQSGAPELWCPEKWGGRGKPLVRKGGYFWKLLRPPWVGGVCHHPASAGPPMAVHTGGFWVQPPSRRTLNLVQPSFH